VVGSIFWSMRYLITVTPTGSIRMSLMKPSNATPANLLPYCLANASEYNGFENYNCTYWDEDFVVFPSVEDRDIFCTTRVTMSQEALNCDLTDYRCQYSLLSNVTQYIPDIERFTLLIDHTVYAEGILQRNAMQIPGKLIDTNGNPMKLTLPNQVGFNVSDVLELGVLMKAAGFNSLDAKSDISNANATFRNYGIVFFCLYHLFKCLFI